MLITTYLIYYLNNYVKIVYLKFGVFKYLLLYSCKQIKKHKKTYMKNLSFVITISHNQVSEKISVMCQPSKMTIVLDEQKTKVYHEVKMFNPNIVRIWAQQIWDINYPKTFGKVIDVQILN